MLRAKIAQVRQQLTFDGNNSLSIERVNSQSISIMMNLFSVCTVMTNRMVLTQDAKMGLTELSYSRCVSVVLKKALPVLEFL